MIRKILLTAVVLGIVFLGTAQPARAGYSYTIFDDGVDQTGLVTPAGNIFADVISTPNFTITILSSFTVQTSGGTVLNTNLQATLNPAAIGQHEIMVKLNFDDYALPPGSPLNASTAASATFTNSPTTTDDASAQAWGDPGNSSAFESGATGGAQTGASAGTPGAFGVTLQPNPATFLLARVGNYSLSQTLAGSISQSGDAVEAVQVQATTTVTSIAAIPEPATMAMLLSGLPLAAGALYRRRKMAKA
jgi:hypothetical protein